MKIDIKKIDLENIDDVFEKKQKIKKKVNNDENSIKNDRIKKKNKPKRGGKE